MTADARGAGRCPICGAAPFEGGRCGSCDHELAWASEGGAPASGPDAEALVALERRRGTLRIQRDLIPIGATDAVLLEVGASTGGVIAAAQAAGFQPRGIEADPARRALARTHNAVELFEGVLDARVPTASAGVLLLSGVLATAVEPLRLIEQARRVLAPHGLLLAAVPASASAYCGAIDPPDVTLQRFSPASLARALSDGGFSLLDCYSPDGHELLAAGLPA